MLDRSKTYTKYEIRTLIAEGKYRRDHMFLEILVNWGDTSHFTSLFKYQGIDRVNINLLLASFPNS